MEKEEEEEEKVAENIRLGKGGGVESEPISDIQPDKYRKRDNGTVRQTVRETESWRQREKDKVLNVGNFFL